MKILMVSSYLPYPLLDGGRIRLYNLMKLLGEKHEITLICEKWGQQTQKDVDEIRKICKKVIAIDRPKAFSVRNISKSLSSLEPLLSVVHTNKEIKEQIKNELNSSKFDLIHVETFYVMQNLPAGKAGLPQVQIPVVLAEHNIEYEVYLKYAKKRPFFIRPVYMMDVLKLKRREKDFWKKSNKLIAVSEADGKIMGGDVAIVPNGVDLDKFKMKKILNGKKDKVILFIGNFKWLQNRDSVAFILNNIWPKIISQNKKGLNIKLWVVGKNIPDSIKNSVSGFVEFDEKASNATEEIFQKADLLLAPIRVGGGTSYKILEAMASGTPVLTTSLGNEGINARDGSEILIAEKPDEFAREALSILSDDYLYEKISRNGRKFIEKNYDWKNIVKKLEAVYLSALNK